MELSISVINWDQVEKSKLFLSFASFLIRELALASRLLQGAEATGTASPWAAEEGYNVALEVYLLSRR